ncbi:MAG: DoxX family protein [Myxococcales bacterium]|nr:MAG: DoxX family protein [Myxococcales bacterium]
MAAFMKPYTAQSYALLRIITGAMFLSHGCQKLFGWPGVPPADAPTFILYTAGPIELVGGALIAAGLFTRWAAFICSGTMAAAYWMAHGFNHLLPILNHGELAVLYCFVFLYIATNGSGMWSVDAARGDA